MNAVTLSVEIPANHHLELDLPPELPVGTAQITIHPQLLSDESMATNAAREVIRAKMLAAGILSTVHRAPEGAHSLPPEERERIWKLFSQGRPSDELINEDRGKY